jgi:SAM-dependent methyltransferase
VEGNKREKMENPHFDHHRVIWKDEYSGLYQPVDYGEQFDHEWRLFLEKKTGFYHHAGVETDDAWIDDRIFDLTGVEWYSRTPKEHSTPQDRNVGGRQHLDLKFAVDYFRGKRCLDAGCGAGRWTKTLIALGAQVKSIDVSEYGLESVRRFNTDVECLDLFDIANRPDLHQAFDFTICWGVIMCTHDPKAAFEDVAMTVKPGGGFYVMIYAPTFHNSPPILAQRGHFHKNLHTFEERLAYAYSIADRPENAINYLDMLNTFYNWVVEEQTIHNWFRSNGFLDVITLNVSERNPVAYHVFGRKRDFDPPTRDDYGDLIPRIAAFDVTKAIPLKRPFQKEIGFAWQANTSEWAASADDLEHLYRSTLVLLENGQPLWSRHTLHDEIRIYGQGRYSHWQDTLLFSTPDNSDPNTNGCTYAIVFAESA